MSMLTHPLFLRRILLADALISGATGLLMALGAPKLAEFLGIPASLLRYSGWSLLPFALLVGSLSRSRTLAREAVLTVVGVNVAWVAASVLLLVTGAIHPNGLGSLFVLGQAAAVGVLAELQYFGLRRAVVAA